MTAESGTAAADVLAIVQLARLPRIEYDRCRLAEAERLGIRVSTLDREVDAARIADGGGSAKAGQGRPLTFPDIDPWPEAVDGAALLGALTLEIRRFVIIGMEAARAIALWVVFTHAFAAASVAPKLFITSPQKRSGKTRLIEVLAYLVARAETAAHLTAATLFRVIEEYCPTLLIDEADTFMRANEELRGLVNSGFNRETAHVLRNVPVGDGWEVREFSTWCPQVLAAIGRLPDTIVDRSIVIEMARKLRTERVARLRRRDASPLIDLARKAARWATDHLREIETSLPEMPGGLNDRAADAWEICVAIADVAGGDWPRFAREAALKLSADGVVEDESIGTMLLADIRATFIEHKTDRLTSAALVEHLVALEDRPWAEFGRTQNAITKNRVAALLKPHKISPVTIRIGLSSKDTAKGYNRRQFEDAFERHLPPFSSENVTPSQPEDSPDIPANSKTSQAEECDTFEMPRNPNNSACCDCVTDREALSPEDTKEWRF